MKSKIREFIFDRNDVSFPELMRAIPGSEGERVLCTYDDNIILWEGLSKAFVEAFEALLVEGSIAMKPVSLRQIELIHAFTRDGLLDYPIAKQLRKYVRPHWFPVIIVACKEEKKSNTIV